MTKSPKIIQIRKNILEDNDINAQKLRDKFKKHKILVVNIVSSPGSGKTELLTKLIPELNKQGIKVSVIVGDLKTENDANRIKKTRASTYQIQTDGNCHLEAHMIENALKNIDWKNSDILIIENVGNLVCPANYDLGENLRIVLMSVTEGEDKPLKYPTMFNSADVCVISKIDLAEAVEFNKKLAITNLKKINPDLKIIEASAKTLTGIKTLAETLIKY